MVIYYIKKKGESLADYRYPIKEGDICMLYDGEVIKTVYIDSELDSNSIWRDFKFIDTKSLKSYHFPTSDSILCAPIGDKHAIGDTGLLTQLIKECKGEWLLDFLNETSAVLSGFVDYWDLGILRRFTGDEDVKITYENYEALTEFLEKPEEHNEYDEFDTEEKVDDTDLSPKSNDIKLFCLSALACIEDQIDKRNYQILYDMLNGISRNEIADRHHLTQERIRQIVVTATKQARELLIEQHKSIEETKAKNAQLNAQLKLLKDDIIRLKALLPKEAITHLGENEELSTKLALLLETPIKNIDLPVRATNILLSMGIKIFADIPQIDSRMQLLKVRNSGRKTVHDVSRLLEDFYLTFGMSYPEIVNILRSKDWNTAEKKWIKESRNNNKKKQERIDKITPEGAMVELTKDIIEAARTPNGGFTKSQLAAIGVHWPPPQDWIPQNVGKLISQKQYEEFMRIVYIKSASVSTRQKKRKRVYNLVEDIEKKRIKIVRRVISRFKYYTSVNEIINAINDSEWGGVVKEHEIRKILESLPDVKYIKWCDRYSIP